MKNFLQVLGLAVAVAIPCLPTLSVLAETKPSVAIAVESVSLKDVASDRVFFAINLQVTSDTKLKTKRVQFEHMRLGSMPIYLSPITQPLQLEKDVPYTLPPVPLTIFFRDLDSLEPLQQAVREGRARVTGNAHVDLDLNLFEQIASRQWTPNADLPIAVSAPIEVPGGFIGQAAIVASLTAAQVAMDAGGSALSALRVSQRAWEQELKTRYAPSMVIAESRYSIRTRDGQKIDFAVRGLGFRISEDKFVLTDEMIQPWKYDTEVVTAIDSGKATLAEESRELLVAPNSDTFNPSTARSLSRKEIQVEHQSDKSDITHVPTDKGPKAIKILRRDTENNYAVLRFTSSGDKASAVPVAPENVRHEDSWDRLAMFFVDHDGQLELVSSAANRQDKRITLDDPIDDRSFGSLLIAREGAVGMVQDEHQGMVLRSNW